MSGEYQSDKEYYSGIWYITGNGRQRMLLPRFEAFVNVIMHNEVVELSAIEGYFGLVACL